MKKLLKSVICAVLCACVAFSGTVWAYAGDNIYGVDVSYHNTQENGNAVDFSDLENKNMSFVMIRLGYYNHIDSEFWNNVKKANEAKVNFGVYLYSYAYSQEEALIEAKFVIDTLSQLGEYGEYFTLPVAYDMEDANLTKFGKKQLTAQMTCFCDSIKNAGYTPMVYANNNFFTNYIDINTAVSKGYKIWYAYYPSAADTSKQIEVGTTKVKADMWQYTNGGKAFNCDENVLFNQSLISKPACVHSYATSLVTNKASYSKNGGFVLSGKCSLCEKTFSKTVTINKASSVSISCASYTYNGKAKTPSVKVKDSSGTALVKETDYTVKYANERKKVGKYSVVINFKGNYTGSKTLYFKINPKGTSISKITAGKKAFTVKWNKQKTQTTGYQIQYSTSSKFKSAKTVTVSKNSTTSKTVKKLSAKKKYYVRVRTYKTVGKTKYYSSWSKAKSVKTK